MAHTAQHGMGRAQLAAKIELFEAEVRALKRISTSCTVCIYGEQALTCKKWGKVPSQVWQAGCPDWAWDEIPF